MINPIKVSEINKTIEITASTLFNNELEITNTSSGYINNLKIVIQNSDFSILEQAIIRRRGALHFSPTEHCLELGNLAPEESAFFEYKFTSSSSLSSLSPHLTLSYCLEDTPEETKLTVSDLLTSHTVPSDTPEETKLTALDLLTPHAVPSDTNDSK